MQIHIIPPMSDKIIQEVRQALTDCADKGTLESSSRFFKKGEEALVYGVKMGEVRIIGKGFFKEIKNLRKQEIFAICEGLWKSGYLEEAVIACIWSEALHKIYEPADFAVFERWVKNYVRTWADCDTLCNHTIGSFILMYPKYVDELKEWAKSPNRWVKRAAAVTLILPARKGQFLNDIFDIADILLTDPDDLVQKGYGWMLKAASEAYPKEVFEYVEAKKAVMPRTALRYAIEKMPLELRTQAMKK